MSGSGSLEEAPLSELCSICHINVPKYKCPRCFIRTCSLPCTQRHKKWSQCSGVRDPAAYLRRSELATPAAFDRDFNFITGIERGMERAEREAENRGIGLDHDYICSLEGKGLANKKRKRPQEMVRGEAGFLRGAETAGVKLLRAPRGLTRNLENSSRWHPKHKCLSWTIEWITPSGERTLSNCLETWTPADAYDRIYPLPKEEQEKKKRGKRPAFKGPAGEPSTSESHEQQPPSTMGVSTTGLEPESDTTADNDQQLPSTSQPTEPLPHRNNLYFYLHRPRTATRRKVLIPLSPTVPFNSALRNRTILEFPTIYVLESSPNELHATTEEEGENSEFVLDEKYLRRRKEQTGGEDDTSSSGSDDDDDDDESEEDEEEEEEENQPATSTSAIANLNLNNIDEKRVLDVLKQDLFQAT